MSTASAAASYRGLFAEPALRRLAVADACARLPQGMVSLTLLLVAAERASMAVAGLVVAGYTLAQAVTGPARGRLADRRGLIPVAAACAPGYALALFALLASAFVQAPAGVLIGAGAVAGLVNPPLSPGLRSLWSAQAGPGWRGPRSRWMPRCSTWLTSPGRCWPASWPPASPRPRRWRCCSR